LRAGGPPTCQYELLVVDSPRADVTTVSRPYRYVDVTRAGEVEAYVIHGKPWRTYAAVPIWRSGEHSGFAGELVLLGFYQRKGSNIRGTALLLFIAQLALATVTVLAIRWLLMRYWTRTGSWRSVFLLSAGGGAIAGVLFVLRPPDVGGYDEPLDPFSCAVLVTMLAGVFGITGCFFGWLRELLDRTAPRRRLLLTLFVFPFAALMTVGLATKWSALSRLTSADTVAQVRTAFYIYFATSVALPLVLFHETAAHTDKVAEIHSRLRRLFGVTAVSSLLALLVGFLVSELLDVATPGQIFRGFYKTAGGVGLWLVSLFIIAALSFALVLGTRPRWIEELNEALSRFADKSDPLDRLRYRNRVLDAVFAHTNSISAHRRHLAFAARQAPRVIQSTLEQPLEIEQFVSRMERPGSVRVTIDEARQRFTRALEALATIDPEESRLEVPLLLIDEQTHEFVQGKLRVARFFDPGSRGGIHVDVCQKGIPLDPDSSLCRSVRTLVDLLNEEIVPRIRKDAFDRHRIEVDFQYDQDADLSGASYELPLALAVIGFLVEARLSRYTWAATGQIDRRTCRVDVVDLDTKCAFLLSGEGRRLLISATSAVSTCRTAATTVLFTDDAQGQALQQIRRSTLDALARGRAVLLGVTTVHQAIEILYGVNVTIAKH
jgi:hypothetical protein